MIWKRQETLNRVKLVRITVIKACAEQFLTVSSIASELVSLRWRLEVDSGGLEGATRNSLSSSRIVTGHNTSPTNARASLAVMALEKPLPCITEKQWSSYWNQSPFKAFFSKRHPKSVVNKILALMLMMLFSVMAYKSVKKNERGVLMVNKLCQSSSLSCPADDRS